VKDQLHAGEGRRDPRTHEPCVSEITPTTYTSRFMSDRLFTPRFFVMCGFTFTVFLSAFQLLPTAPFRIMELGGTTFASGLFLGFLTYASALSAPLTGAIADRIGRRRTLIIASASSCCARSATARPTSYRVMLALVVVHGVFWSGLLSASAAYLTSLLPERRRAEGHQLLGPVERRRDRGRAADRLLDHGARRLDLDLPVLRHAQRADGRHRLLARRIAGRRHRSSRCRSRPTRRAGARRMAVLALSLTLSSTHSATRDHQLQRDVCRRDRRRAEEPVSDRARHRDPPDAPALGEARRPHRLPAGVHAVPDPHRGRPDAARHRIDTGSRSSSRRPSSASASAPPTRSLSPT
jgi:hypothetical protein